MPAQCISGLYKCNNYLVTPYNLKLLDVKFTDYDYQLILDFIYLLPMHSYIFDTLWLLEGLTGWLFGLPKTENVVNTSERHRTDNMVVMQKIANEYPKYRTHWYNVHFILDSDDECRKIYEHASKTSYEFQKRLELLKSSESEDRQTLDVYCIITREPQFSLYYPTEKTIPKKYRVNVGDTK